MGIDVYMRWPRQTEAQRKAMFTGFNTEAGNVGYLREAYHGGPYVTQFLLQECWAAEDQRDGIAIPAATLRARLPAAVAIALYRDHVVYEQGTDPSAIKVADGDADGGGGVALMKRLATILAVNMRDDGEGHDIAKHLNAEQLRALGERIAARQLPGYALAFVDFVLLAERREAEYGEPVRIYASY